MKFTDLRLPPRRGLFSGLNDFFIESQVGDGGFSVVFLARLRADNQMFAIKKIDLSVLFDFNQDNIEKEIEAHSKFDHPNIVKFYDYFGEEHFLYLVLEYCPAGSLFFYVMKYGLLSLQNIKKYFEQTIHGIMYVHEKGYIIRDLKPENMLLDTNLNVKLCDFGWSVGLHDFEFRKSKAGTFAYMSPESLKGELQDEKTDVWSLGILLYELFVGKEPYTADNFFDQLDNIAKGFPGYPPNINVPPEAHILILQMLQTNKNLRPTLTEILNSEFMTGVVPVTRYSSPAVSRKSSELASIVTPKPVPTEKQTEKNSTDNNLLNSNDKENHFEKSGEPKRRVTVYSIDSKRPTIVQTLYESEGSVQVPISKPLTVIHENNKYQKPVLKTAYSAEVTSTIYSSLPATTIARQQSEYINDDKSKQSIKLVRRITFDENLQSVSGKPLSVDQFKANSSLNTNFYPSATPALSQKLEKPPVFYSPPVQFQKTANTTTYNIPLNSPNLLHPNWQPNNQTTLKTNNFSKPEMQTKTTIRIMQSPSPPSVKNEGMKVLVNQTSFLSSSQQTTQIQKSLSNQESFTMKSFQNSPTLQKMSFQKTLTTQESLTLYQQIPTKTQKLETPIQPFTFISQKENYEKPTPTPQTFSSPQIKVTRIGLDGKTVDAGSLPQSPNFYQDQQKSKEQSERSRFSSCDNPPPQIQKPTIAPTVKPIGINSFMVNPANFASAQQKQTEQAKVQKPLSGSFGFKQATEFSKPQSNYTLNVKITPQTPLLPKKDTPKAEHMPFTPNINVENRVFSKPTPMKIEEHRQTKDTDENAASYARTLDFKKHMEFDVKKPSIDLSKPDQLQQMKAKLNAILGKAKKGFKDSPKSKGASGQHSSSKADNFTAYAKQVTKPSVLSKFPLRLDSASKKEEKASDHKLFSGNVKMLVSPPIMKLKSSGLKESSPKAEGTADGKSRVFKLEGSSLKGRNLAKEYFHLAL